MRIKLTSEQIAAKKKKNRERKHERKASKPAGDTWLTELLVLPIDARISRMASAISRETVYSFISGTFEFSVSLTSLSGIAAPRGECQVITSINGATIAVEKFGAASRAAAYFLTKVNVYNHNDLAIRETVGSPISQFTQDASRRDPTRKVFEQF